MAIITDTKYKGQAKTDVLNGSIRIEDGNNRLVVFDGENLRLILGVWPDGTIGLIISKPGIDVISAFS